ncbi:MULTISPECIES: sugar ABC transporter permease [unclassified Rhizobium]|uniref:carbohydrate ABC transporter permease n=1 Tax=Rhizobium TaxID=379 RepID=UPI00084C07B0|nr:MULTISPECIES: sugar ABC transporter permease [unclassified Rhizobium]OEC95090.1 sugar ABC transporter permease [Rhizobium sp. YK2]QYA16041.1 sugar ABC transporter permease [Rhizobium sp. AB2/73]UEQ84584.1 sugar ABC transporter permease [Rhizobium sp. AB2/73]
MGIRWSRATPHLAVAPAVLLTLVFFIGSIGWTVYLSFTASRRFPDYELVGWKQYWRLFHDASWLLSLQNLLIFALGSLLSIVVGFVLAALIDKEVHGEGIFRTVFLYPLAVSLIVTGLVWRWLFNPGLGVENVLHSLGWQSASFNWLASQDTVMFGVILAAIWQSTGFFMALMLSGLKSINTEIWQAARLDGVPFWRLYIEVIIPTMKLTFLTCIILLCIGVVKAYDIIVAMTNAGPGGASIMPAYFVIDAYWQKQNLGFASAGATVMLLTTLVLFLPLVIITVIRQRNAT